MAESYGMKDQFWQPDDQTRAAIRCGDRLCREYFKRKSIEYELVMIERVAGHQKVTDIALGDNAQ